MAAFLFLLVLAAVAGVLGAVLKVVAMLILAVALGITIVAWLAWRSIRRQVRRATVTQADGSTVITVGPARRERPPTAGGTPAAPAHDDRY